MDYGETMDIDSEEAVNNITRTVALARGDESHYQSQQLHQQGYIQSSVYTKEMIYLVVDTNFIISHLQIIDNLVGLWEFYHRMYQIVIPKQVIQELDGLKESTNESKYSIANVARKAIDWCYSHFHDVTPQVRGQKMMEKIDDSASKDNSILDCCIFFKSKELGGGSMVVLLSNDKNLCNKALINNILTVSYRNEMNANLIAERAITELMSGLQNQNHQQNTGNLIDTHAPLKVVKQPEFNQTDGFHQQPQVNEDDDMMIIEDDHQYNTPPHHPVADLNKICQDIYDQANILVKEALTFAVEQIFGDDTKLSGYDADNIKTLVDAGTCIQRMYSSTFIDFFTGRRSFNPSKFLKYRTEIKRLGTKPVSVVDLTDFENFWSQFLQGIYNERSMDQRKALKQIISNWEKMLASI